jgi:hypothetical protein
MKAVVGFVTKASVKAGCPKPVNTAITRTFPTEKEAVKWAKQSKLRNWTLHDVNL